jgi:hypothetical protein
MRLSKLKAFPLVVLLAFTVPLTACMDGVEEVKMTFINNSDSLICLHGSQAAADSGQFCNELKPHAVTVWRTGCGRGDPTVIRRYDVTVVLAKGVGGSVIYERSAACGDWQDSHATFIINPRGDNYVVEDSLPER